jgi:hypothetical protein
MVLHQMSEPPSKSPPSNRKFYLLVAAIVLAAVLTGVVSARRGKSSVEQWKDEQRAKGEKFTIAELLAGRTAAKTNRLDELVRLGKLLGASGKALGAIEHFRYLSNGVAEAAWMRPKLGMSVAAPGTTGGRGVPSSVVPYEWEDLAADLAAMETALAEVHALLAVPDRDTGWNYQHGTPMPKCFVEKRHLAQWLAAANTHALHARQPAQAAAHLTALCNLVGWHDEDFSLIGQLIRVAIGGMALHSTWATIQAPGVTEAQLAGLQTQWQGLAIVPTLARALEFERAGMAKHIAAARSGQESFKAIGAGVTGAGTAADGVVGLAWRAFAAEADELFFLKAMQRQIEAVRKLGRLRSWESIQLDQADIAAELATLERGTGRLLVLSRMALPNLRGFSRTAIRYETRRELTIAALAIERHRRKHGRPPAKLVDLVPAFLSAVPVDWMDGNPLRYRLNADGTFTLWSIGEDLKDDGGDGSDAAPATRTTDIWDRKDVLWPRPLP